MNESDVRVQKRSLFTVKNILRILSLLCIIFVFCPSFLVSCSGENLNVDVMTAVGGLYSYDYTEEYVEPHPIMLICLILPAVVLFVLFIKKYADKKIAGIICGCSLIDFIAWIMFRTAAKKIAEDYMCEFKTTGWYVINLIVILLLTALSALVMLGKISMECDLKLLLSGGDNSRVYEQRSMNRDNNISPGNVSTSDKNTGIGFCTKCGNAIQCGCKFCPVCGTLIPESIIAKSDVARQEAEEKTRFVEVVAKKAEEKHSVNEVEKVTWGERKPEDTDGNIRFCQRCGAKLECGASFCKSCGTKAE